MRFLLNMNVPRSLGRRLVAAGHECRHAGEIGLSFSGDAFSGEQAPSVIIVRLRNTHPDNLLARILSSLREIEEPLLSGAIVALEDATVRVRRLPIERKSE